MDEIIRSLSEENNNKVFKHIFMLQMMKCDEFSYHEDYYLIKDGIVFAIQELKKGTNEYLYPSGDSIIETCSRGLPCGEFDENKKYSKVVKFFKLKDFKKQMKGFLSD